MENEECYTKKVLKKIIYISTFLFILLINNFIHTPVLPLQTVYADTIISNVNATASSYVAPYSPSRAVDSRLTAAASRWYCTGTEKWLQLDLKNTYYIDRWVVTNLQAAGWNASCNTKGYKLRGSTDGVTWTDIDVVSDNTLSVTDRKISPFSARYVQLYITAGNQDNNNWASILEFQVYAAPTVSLVSVPANGTYKAGQNLDFTVNFSENVNITGTDSTLSLNVGGVTKQASFISQTANSVTYRYTVQSGDLDTDGIAVGAINLNTTTIRDVLSNNAVTVLNNVVSTATVLVDAVPKITIASLTGGSITASPITAVQGSTINLTITPNPGMRLKEGTLKYSDGTDHSISGTSFTMPASDVIVSAEFETMPTVPIVVTNPAITTVGTTAVVEGNILGDGGASVTERGIVYSNIPSPQIGLPETIKVVASGANLGVYTANLTGLMPGPYFAKAYAINSAGISYGPEIIFNITTPINPSLSVITEGTGNISVNGGPQGPIVTEDYPLGMNITLTAYDSESSPFMYWVDANNRLVSTDKTYIFKLGSETFLKAVFGTKTANTHLVVFKNGNGEIIQSSYVDISSSIAFPTSPYMYGYTFIGWDKTSDQIQAVAGDVEVNALFQKNPTKYNVSVTNGIVTNGTVDGVINNGVCTGAYDVKDYVTVTANSAPTRQKFSHWIDSNGNILCYDFTYRFYVAYDINLTAVYVADTSIVEQQASIVITSITKDISSNKITFVAERIIPEGCIVLSHGIILTSNTATGTSETSFKIGGTGVLKGTAKTTGLVGTYVLSKINVSIGQTWYARGYVVYKDKNGNLVTLYSNIASETM